MQGEPASTARDEAEASLTWRRFPAGRGRIVANRWLDRRRALLFVAWFCLVLVPALALISWAARVGGVAGFVLLAVAVVVAFYVPVLPMVSVGEWRTTVNSASAIDGHTLLTKHGQRQPIDQDLHAGVIEVLEPGWRRGRAHVLGVHTDPAMDGSLDLVGLVLLPLLPVVKARRRATPWRLLSNPATGELRDARDLRQLADVLCASPMERDRVVGRTVLALSARAADTTAAQPEPDELPRGVWTALKSVGRTLPLLPAILVTIVVGGSIEAWRETGAGDAVANTAVHILLLSGVAAAASWSVYFLYRLGGLLAATVRAAARLRR
ncbi:hypothetical protein [Asanoa hainanensis]|uniref:hypothetical protein n=1 Tax=Asanoa hainanensis TaxID=560556 RepID=UPI000B77A160|nr:hypothetical protein [Asanoa hainanensis]